MKYKYKPKKRIIEYHCFECRKKQVQAWIQMGTVKCGDCQTVWKTDWEYRECDNDRGYPSYYGIYGLIHPTRREDIFITEKVKE
jgi:hypothetical protein